MALTVSIVRPATTATAASKSQPNFVLIGSSGTRITLPYAPLPLTHKAGMGWETVPRSGRGRTALVLEGNPTPPTLSFNLVLAKPDVQADVESWLSALTSAANGTQRWTVSYGPQEKGLWRITDFSYDAEQRQQYTNRVTRATVQLTLTAAGSAQDLKPTVAPKPVKPAPKPAKPVPPKPAKPAAAPAVSSQVNTFYKALAADPKAAAYFTAVSQLASQVRKSSTRPSSCTIKHGDTLTGIAVKFYGDPKFMQLLAGINGIKNPAAIKAGQVIKLYNPS